jgi:hypothetical protein
MSFFYFIHMTQKPWSQYIVKTKKNMWFGESDTSDNVSIVSIYSSIFFLTACVFECQWLYGKV